MSFNFVAQVQLQAAGVQQVAQQIGSALRGVTSGVNVQVNPASMRGIQALNQQVTQLRTNLAALQGAAASVPTSVASIGSAAQAASAGMTSMGSGATQAATAMQQMRTGAAAAGESVNTFGNLIGLASRRFLAFTAGAGSIVALTRGFREGVTEAISFERELIRVQQVSNELPSQLRVISEEATRLATNTGVSSAELAKGATIFVQAGINAKETAALLRTLADAALAPNFEGISQTAEGAIASMRQFKLDAAGTREAIGAMNAVAGEFAVEGRDLIEVVRKTGGAFKQAGGDINELIALFTSVRATTRESAEEIATGLRTIFTRIQRPETVETLRELGVQLRYTREEAQAMGNTSLESQFVGAYEAVKRLSEGLSGLRTSDPRYSQIVEELGGYRQVSRVIPLIQQQATAQQAYNVALTGGQSLTRSTEKAQESLAIKLSKVKEEFLALFRAVNENAGFKAFADGALFLASSFGKVLEFLQPMVPLLSAFAAIKIGQSIGSLFAGASSTFLTGRSSGGPPTVPIRRATGGIVPGVGDTDSVPAFLTPGEFVINKRSAQRIGYQQLHQMNDGGPVARMAAGGPTPAQPFVLNPQAIKAVFAELSQSSGIDLGKLIKKVHVNDTGLRPGVASDTQFYGSFNRKTRSVYLNNTVIDSHEKLRSTLAHELGHAFDTRLNRGRNYTSEEEFSPASIAAETYARKERALLENRSDQRRDYNSAPREAFANFFRDTLLGQSDAVSEQDLKRFDKVFLSAGRKFFPYRKQAGVAQYASGGLVRLSRDLIPTLTASAFQVAVGEDSKELSAEARRYLEGLGEKPRSRAAVRLPFALQGLSSADPRGSLLSLLSQGGPGALKGVVPDEALPTLLAAYRARRGVALQVPKDQESAVNVLANATKVNRHAAEGTDYQKSIQGYFADQAFGLAQRRSGIDLTSFGRVVPHALVDRNSNLYGELNSRNNTSGDFDGAYLRGNRVVATSYRGAKPWDLRTSTNALLTPPPDLAQTILHEYVHAIDNLGGTRVSGRRDSYLSLMAGPKSPLADFLSLANTETQQYARRQGLNQDQRAYFLNPTELLAYGAEHAAFEDLIPSDRRRFSSRLGELGRKQVLPYLASQANTIAADWRAGGGALRYAVGGVVLPRDQRASLSELQTSIKSYYEKRDNYPIAAGGTIADYLARLSKVTLTPQARSAIPKGSEFIGHGIAAIAFRTPDGDVIRLQSEQGAYKLARQAKPGISPDVLSTDRPNIDTVLQPLATARLGSGKKAVHYEKLPYAEDVDLPPAALRGVIDNLQIRSLREGYIFKDAHVGNIGLYQGRYVIRDAGAVVPLPSGSALQPREQRPVKHQESTAEYQGAILGGASSLTPPTAPRGVGPVVLPATVIPSEVQRMLHSFSQTPPTKLATGGSVGGDGGGDKVPALLTPGEFVLNRDAVARIGMARLHQLNVRGYAQGGLVRRYATGDRVEGGADLFKAGSDDIRVKIGDLTKTIEQLATRFRLTVQQVDRLNQAIQQAAKDANLSGPRLAGATGTFGQRQVNGQNELLFLGLSKSRGRLNDTPLPLSQQAQAIQLARPAAPAVAAATAAPVPNSQLTYRSALNTQGGSVALAGLPEIQRAGGATLDTARSYLEERAKTAGRPYTLEVGGQPFYTQLPGPNYKAPATAPSPAPAPAVVERPSRTSQQASLAPVGVPYATLRGRQAVVAQRAQAIDAGTAGNYFLENPLAQERGSSLARPHGFLGADAPRQLSFAQALQGASNAAGQLKTPQTLQVAGLPFVTALPKKGYVAPDSAPVLPPQVAVPSQRPVAPNVVRQSSGPLSLAQLPGVGQYTPFQGPVVRPSVAEVLAPTGEVVGTTPVSFERTREVARQRAAETSRLTRVLDAGAGAPTSGTAQLIAPTGEVIGGTPFVAQPSPRGLPSQRALGWNGQPGAGTIINALTNDPLRAFSGPFQGPVVPPPTPQPRAAIPMGWAGYPNVPQGGQLALGWNGQLPPSPAQQPPAALFNAASASAAETSILRRAIDGTAVPPTAPPEVTGSAAAGSSVTERYPLQLRSALQPLPIRPMVPIKDLPVYKQRPKDPFAIWSGEEKLPLKNIGDVLAGLTSRYNLQPPQVEGLNEAIELTSKATGLKASQVARTSGYFGTGLIEGQRELLFKGFVGYQDAPPEDNVPPLPEEARKVQLAAIAAARTARATTPPVAPLPAPTKPAAAAVKPVDTTSLLNDPRIAGLVSTLRIDDKDPFGFRKGDQSLPLKPQDFGKASSFGIGIPELQQIAKSLPAGAIPGDESVSSYVYGRVRTNPLSGPSSNSLILKGTRDAAGNYLPLSSEALAAQLQSFVPPEKQKRTAQGAVAATQIDDELKTREAELKARQAMEAAEAAAASSDKKKPVKPLTPEQAALLASNKGQIDATIASLSEKYKSRGVDVAGLAQRRLPVYAEQFATKGKEGESFGQFVERGLDRAVLSQRRELPNLTPDQFALLEKNQRGVAGYTRLIAGKTGSVPGLDIEDLAGKTALFAAADYNPAAPPVNKKGEQLTFSQFFGRQLSRSVRTQIQRLGRRGTALLGEQTTGTDPDSGRVLSVADTAAVQGSVAKQGLNNETADPAERIVARGDAANPAVQKVLSDPFFQGVTDERLRSRLVDVLNRASARGRDPQAVLDRLKQSAERIAASRSQNLTARNEVQKLGKELGVTGAASGTGISGKDATAVQGEAITRALTGGVDVSRPDDAQQSVVGNLLAQAGAIVPPGSPPGSGVVAAAGGAEEPGRGKGKGKGKGKLTPEQIRAQRRQEALQRLQALGVDVQGGAANPLQTGQLKALAGVAGRLPASVQGLLAAGGSRLQVSTGLLTEIPGLEGLSNPEAAGVANEGPKNLLAVSNKAAARDAQAYNDPKSPLYRGRATLLHERGHDLDRVLGGALIKTDGAVASGLAATGTYGARVSSGTGFQQVQGDFIDYLKKTGGPGNTKLGPKQLEHYTSNPQEAFAEAFNQYSFDAGSKAKLPPTVIAYFDNLLKLVDQNKKQLLGLVQGTATAGGPLTQSSAVTPQVAKQRAVEEAKKQGLYQAPSSIDAEARAYNDQVLQQVRRSGTTDLSREQALVRRADPKLAKQYDAAIAGNIKDYTEREAVIGRFTQKVEQLRQKLLEIRRVNREGGDLPGSQATVADQAVSMVGTGRVVRGATPIDRVVTEAGKENPSERAVQERQAALQRLRDRRNRIDPDELRTVTYDVNNPLEGRNQRETLNRAERERQSRANRGVAAIEGGRRAGEFRDELDERTRRSSPLIRTDYGVGANGQRVIVSARSERFDALTEANRQAQEAATREQRRAAQRAIGAGSDPLAQRAELRRLGIGLADENESVETLRNLRKRNQRAERDAASIANPEQPNRALTPGSGFTPEEFKNFYRQQLLSTTSVEARQNILTTAQGSLNNNLITPIIYAQLLKLAQTGAGAVRGVRANDPSSNVIASGVRSAVGFSEQYAGPVGSGVSTAQAVAEQRAAMRQARTGPNLATPQEQADFQAQMDAGLARHRRIGELAEQSKVERDALIRQQTLGAIRFRRRSLRGFRTFNETDPLTGEVTQNSFNRAAYYDPLGRTAIPAIYGTSPDALQDARLERDAQNLRLGQLGGFVQSRYLSPISAARQAAGADPGEALFIQSEIDAGRRPVSSFNQTRGLQTNAQAISEQQARLARGQATVDADSLAANASRQAVNPAAAERRRLQRQIGGFSQDELKQFALQQFRSGQGSQELLDYLRTGGSDGGALLGGAALGQVIKAAQKAGFTPSDANQQALDASVRQASQQAQTSVAAGRSNVQQQREPDQRLAQQGGRELYLRKFDEQGNLIERGLVGDRAADLTQRKLAGRGPVVSQTTREETERSQYTRAEQQIQKELLSAQRRLLQAIFPNINAYELDRKAREDVAAALRGEVQVIRDAQGRLLGTKNAVAQATAQNVTAPGAATGFFGKLGEGFSGIRALFTGGGGVGGFVNRFNQLGQTSFGQGLGTSVLLGAPYLSQQISAAAGTAQTAVAGGTEGSYQLAQGVSGGLQGALVGASIGGALGGPIGALVGGAVAAIPAFVQALYSAEKEIREVKIGASLTLFSDRLSSLANATFASDGTSTNVSATVFSDASKQLADYQSLSAERNIREATPNLFFRTLGYGFNAKAYGELQDKSVRQELGGQLPTINQFLTRQAEQIAKKQPNASASDILGVIRGAGNGLNEELIRLIARIRGLPIASVEEELRKNIEGIRRSLRVEREAFAARQGQEGNVNAFSRLLLSVQSATDSLVGLASQAQTLAETFDGVVAASRVTSQSENLTQLGRGDQGALVPLRLIGQLGGPDAERLSAAGTAADEVARVLPGILAEVATNNFKGPTAEQDFATAVSSRLRGQVGDTPQNNAVVSTVISGINEAARARGILGVNQDVQVDVTKFAEKLLAPFAEPLKEVGVRTAKLLEDNANRYIDGITRFRAQINSIGDLRDRQAVISAQADRGRADVLATQTGRRADVLSLISLEQQQRPQQAQLERLTDFQGPAASDPTFVGRQLGRTRERLRDAEERQRQAFQATGGQGPAFQAAAEELVRLKDRAANLQRALSLLTDVATRNAATQERLYKIQEDRQSRLAFGERFLSGDADSRGETLRGLALANVAANKGTLDGFLPQDQQLVLSTLRGLGNARLTGFKDSPIASDVVEKLLRNTMGGVFDVDGARQNEEKELQQKLLENFKRAEEAQKELVERQVDLSQDFLANLRQQQADFFARLEQLLARDKLADAQNRLGTQSREKARLEQLGERRKTLLNLGVTDDAQLAVARSAVEDIRKYADVREQARRTRLAGGEAAKEGSVQSIFSAVYGNILQQPAKGGGWFGGRAGFDPTAQGALLEQLKGRGLGTEESAEVIKRLGANWFSIVGSKGGPGGMDAPTIEAARPRIEAALTKYINEVTNETARRIETVQGAEVEGRLRQKNINPGKLSGLLGGDNSGLQSILDALNAFDGTTNKLEGLDQNIQNTTKSFEDLRDEVNNLKQAVGGNIVGVPAARPQLFASGGSIFKPQGTDTVPAMLTPGEFVVRREAAQANLSLLRRINQARGPVTYLASGGEVQYLADGGLVKEQEEFSKAKERVRRQWAEANEEKRAQLKQQFEKSFTFGFSREALRQRLQTDGEKLGPDWRGYYAGWKEIYDIENREGDKKAIQEAEEARRSIFTVKGAEKEPAPEEAKKRFETRLQEARERYQKGMSRGFLEALERRLPGQDGRLLQGDIENARLAYRFMSPEQRAEFRALREAQASYILDRAEKARMVVINNRTDIQARNGDEYDAMMKGALGFQTEQEAAKLPPEQQAIILDAKRFQYEDQLDLVERKPLAEQKAFWEQNERFVSRDFRELVKRMPQNYTLDERAYYDVLAERHVRWQEVLPRIEAEERQRAEEARKRAEQAQREQQVAAERKAAQARFEEEEGLVNKELARQAALNPFGASALIVSRRTAFERLNRANARLQQPLTARDRAAQAATVENVIAEQRRQGVIRNLLLRQSLVQQSPFAAFGIARPGDQRNIAVEGLQRVQGFNAQSDRRDSLQQRARFFRNPAARLPIGPVQPFGFASGGVVPDYLASGGMAGLGSDTVPAMLTPGEFVVNRQSAQANLPLLEGLNRGDLKVRTFAQGGLVVDGTSRSGGPVAAGVSLGLAPEVVQAFNQLGQRIELLSGSLSAFDSTVGRLLGGFNQFNAAAGKLADALASFPSTLTVSGQQRVEVVFNGAEVLSRITPELKTMLEDAIKVKLNEVFRQYLPDVGVNLE